MKIISFLFLCKAFFWSYNVLSKYWLVTKTFLNIFGNTAVFSFYVMNRAFVVYNIFQSYQQISLQPSNIFFNSFHAILPKKILWPPIFVYSDD